MKKFKLTGGHRKQIQMSVKITSISYSYIVSLLESEGTPHQLGKEDHRPKPKEENTLWLCICSPYGVLKLVRKRKG